MAAASLAEAIFHAILAPARVLLARSDAAWLADLIDRNGQPLALLLLTTLAFVCIRIGLYCWQYRAIALAELDEPATSTLAPAGGRRTSRASRMAARMRSQIATQTMRAKTFAEIFADELDAINERRAALLGADTIVRFKPLGAAVPYAEPSVNFNLCGLALSGGGIRSATYCLGALQALAKHDFLKSVDVLSTVSGGGFTGGALSSLLLDSRFSTRRDEFPLGQVVGQPEGVPLRHLRKSADYLGSTLVDSFIIPSLIIRGWLLNMLALFPIIWGMAMLRRTRWQFATTSFAMSKLIGANILLHMGLHPFVLRPYLSLYIVLAFVSLFYKSLIAMSTEHVALLWSWPVACSALAQVYLANCAMARTERRKVIAARNFGYLALLLVACLAMEALSLVELAYTSVFGSEWNTQLFLGILASLLLSVSLAITVLTDPSISPLRSLLFQLVISVTGPLLLAVYYLEIVVFLQPNFTFFGFRNLLCVATVFISLFCLDTNATSLHAYYRDRLSTAFLFGLAGGPDRAADEPVVPRGDTKLSQLPSRNAPLHIINATVNFSPETAALSLNGEASDSFTFSKLHVGSNATGYRATREFEACEPNLDLGSAISISAAALAPRMGVNTFSNLVPFLGLINVRLGYWIWSPARLALPFFSRLFFGFALITFTKELLDLPPLRASDFKLHVVDGGHTENLGVLALLRRRARYIVSVDAEHDPQFMFGGLATVMRRARLELGVVFELDLAPLRPDARGLVQRPWVVGRVVYKSEARPAPASPRRAASRQDAGPPEGELGYFLYVKASLVGNEDAIIKEFAMRNPSFPHQSTQSQSYSQAQYESYRSLGFGACGKALFGRHGERFDGTDLESFFAGLYRDTHGASDLPAGWTERTAPSGAAYFVHQASNERTWLRPASE